MIQSYFQKRKLKLIMRYWMPAAKRVSLESNIISLKARFFGYLRDIYLNRRDARNKRAINFYTIKLLNKAFVRLTVHKHEQQLLAVAEAFRKQNIMERWRVFIAMRKAQMAIAQKKALQLVQRRNKRTMSIVFGKLRANVSSKHAARMEDHMVTIFQQQVKPLLQKATVIASLRLYQKYTRATERLNHIYKKRVLRRLYLNKKRMQEIRKQRADKLKMAGQHRLLKHFNVFKQILLRKRVN